MPKVVKKNKKAGNKVLKFFVIFGVCLMLLAGSVMMYILSSVTYYNHTIPFDMFKIKAQSISPQFFDLEGNGIETSIDNKYAEFEEISPLFIDAIISIEDKVFYKHNGINYLRTAKAMAKNVLNGRVKEGGSTISQQLVKNKFLTNERTFTRKLKEASLVLRMEKRLTKREIMESYLNSIYYGNNMYGIENASNFYFNKTSKKLNLNEAATLAGIIQAPSRYTKDHDRLLMRRNLVLKEMLKDGKITKEEYDEAITMQLGFKKRDEILASDYISEVIYEASEKLGILKNELLGRELKIYTNFDAEKTKTIKQANKEDKFLHSNILIDKDGRVLALNGRNNKREPGSVVKPFFSFAPALEQNLVTPENFISDEKVDYGNFAPSNYENKYYGNIQVKDALKYSSNTAAVKLTNYAGIQNVKRLARRLGVNLTDKDDLSLSLGRTEKGMNLTEIAGMYTSLLNNGEFVRPSFVDKIEDENGLVLYENIYNKTPAIRDDTAYLLTEMLVECAKTGTAKKLSSLPLTVASKTGTVGIGGERTENTDAYNVCATADLILLTRISSTDRNEENLIPKEITGAGLPTEINRKILERIYDKTSPSRFSTPTSICEVELDAIELEKNNLVLANEFTPERYKTKRHFSVWNVPKVKSVNFVRLDAPEFSLTEVNEAAKISFYADYGKVYELYKNDKLIKTVNSQGYVEVFDEVKGSELTSYTLILKQQNYTDGSTIASEPKTKSIYIKKESKEINTLEVLNKTQEFKESIDTLKETKKASSKKPDVKFNFKKFFEVFR